MILLQIDSFRVKKNSEKEFSAFFSFFEAPKKPKKSKIKENENKRYFPKDAKKDASRHQGNHNNCTPKVP